jgi:hypothetical protein
LGYENYENFRILCRNARHRTLAAVSRSDAAWCWGIPAACLMQGEGERGSCKEREREAHARRGRERLMQGEGERDTCLHASERERGRGRERERPTLAALQYHCWADS